MKRKNKRLSREIARQIRDLYFNRVYKQWEIGEIYGIRQGYVSRIVSGQVWA